ncbi:MAG: ATP-binding protein [Paucibacter sp.]|nr:ATP-binding protein [Roseateles sp.]
MAPVRVSFGIQSRLILGMALAAGLLALALGWSWTSREEQELNLALDHRQTRMASLVALGFAGPIWNLDNIAIKNLLDAVMADPEVHSIELRPVGVNAEPLRRQRSEPAVEPLSRQFDISYQAAPDLAPTVVAQATLVLSREGVYRQVAQMRRFVASLLGAMLAAVVAASLLLVNRLVQRPVQRLGQMARQVSEGRLGATTEVERDDEIGALTEQFNRMSARLLASSEGLQLSEERFRSLFENATEGIFQCDARGRLLSLNRALALMLGFHSPAQAMASGRRLRSLVQIEAQEFKRIALALQRHRLLQQVPLLIATNEGRQLWVELSVHVVPGGGGQGLRIEGMVSDISLRRQAEQELTHYRDHLEEVVTERTRELSEAKARAESASQSKSRFLATMSHEFRTPLNAILGFGQLLQMDASLSPAQQAKVGQIRDAGEHLLSLISDVLDMASIEAGKVRLQPSSVDLRALLDMVADSVRLRAEQKNLDFQVEIDPQLPTRVLVDGQRLRQVLMNLLSNAVKFTDQGRFGLQVSLVAQQDSRARIAFVVHDTGIGIARRMMDRLFKPFEQVAEDARCLGGTGLGLSISQQLLREMGGEIRVRSELGEGSVFEFELSLPTTH